ncbi:polysaccharide biosynthesis protein [Bacillus cereus]|nr:polysaccharide biosynthesis protein [Bacillus cereus]
MKICFAASSGGHLEQMMMLYPMMKKYNGFVLTENTNYKFNSKGIPCHRVIQVNRREPWIIFKMIILCIQSLLVFLKEKPDVVISTGALATVPICLLAKICKKKLIFIESFSKINSPTITGKLMYKYADLFLIQWEELKEFYPDAKYGGGIY